MVEKETKKQKVVIAKLTLGENQKRVNVPKQEETEDWEKGDLIKLEKVDVE